MLNQSSDSYNITTPIISDFTVPAINTATIARIFVFLLGFNATANTPINTFSIQLTSSYLDSTTFRL